MTPEAMTRPYIDLPSKHMPIHMNMGRNDLASLFYELGYTKGVEIGVERGLYSEVLCRSNPNLKLYGVDPLEVYRGYREHVSQDKMDGFYEEVVERMKPYDYELIRKYSLDAVGMFEDGELDFVYIDGNHDFVNTTNDIHAWSRKVKKGGIVSGHDYTRNKKKDYKCHVKDVVQAWTYAHGIHPWFITDGDKSPSWFWIVE
jgi:predicted O-methyltransferase YrrM